MCVPNLVAKIVRSDGRVGEKMGINTDKQRMPQLYIVDVRHDCIMVSSFNCHDSYHMGSTLSLFLRLPVVHASSMESGGHCGSAHCEGG